MNESRSTADDFVKYIIYGVIALCVVGFLFSTSDSCNGPTPAPTQTYATATDDDRDRRATDDAVWSQYVLTSDASNRATAEAAGDGQTSSSVCTSWRDALTCLNRYCCICGVVTHTYDDPNSSAFFIDFTRDETAFYVVDFDYYWEGIIGQCVQVCGIVTLYEGRPQIKNPGQLRQCP